MKETKFSLLLWLIFNVNFVLSSKFVVLYDHILPSDFLYSSNAHASFIQKSKPTLQENIGIGRNISLNKGEHTVFSFSSFDNFLVKYLKANDMKVYEFGNSIKKLERELQSSVLYHSCLWHSTLFKNTVKFLLEILRGRHIAVITDGTHCAQSFLHDLEEAMNAAEDTDDGHAHFHSITFHIGAQFETKTRKHFYDLMTSDISMFLVLLPTQYYGELFKLAGFYSLTSTFKLWLIPNYRQFQQNQPDKLLTFDVLENDVPTSYQNLNISNLAVIYNSFMNESYEYKASQLYANFFHNAYGSNLRGNLIVIRYKDRNDADTDEWITNQAIFQNDKAQIIGDVMNILRISQVKSSRGKVKIVTINDPPFSFVKDDFFVHDTMTCQDGIECMVPKKAENETFFYKSCCIGFTPDILKIILKKVVLPFEMYIIEDGKYGVYKNGKWNGMMGDLISGKADIVLAALTINKERSIAADFTVPYMFDQMGIITKPQTIVPDFLNWGFFDPLAEDLQFLLLLFICLALLLLYFLENIVFFFLYRHDVSIISHYSFLESLSHIAGVTLQRDLGGKHPVRPGARVMSLTYAIAMVIIVSTYTAVLAAQTLKNQEKEPLQGSNDPRFRNPTDDFKFGILRDSSYEAFFKHGETDLIRRMNIFMEKYNYDSLGEGMEMVRNGTLDASFSDFSVLHYYLSKDRTCQMKLVKDKLYSFGMGFALTKGSPYKVLFDHVLLEAVAEDSILELQGKWFDSICQPAFFITTKIQLSIRTFGGLIFILLVTVGLTLFLLYPESIWAKHLHSKIKQGLQNILRGNPHNNVNRSQRCESTTSSATSEYI